MLRLTTRTKLLAGFGAVLALLGIVSAVAVMEMAEVDSRAGEIIERRLPVLYNAEEAASSAISRTARGRPSRRWSREHGGSRTAPRRPIRLAGRSARS